jgi:Cu(I)/Ag(I) efflux system protein CusF
MNTLKMLAAALAAVLIGAQAQGQATPGAAGASAAAATLTDGEVRKVDREAGKLTLRHGRIDNLDMPGMTMVFRVADPSLLAGVKEGDKVRFAAERSGGALTVTRIDVIR